MKAVLPNIRMRYLPSLFFSVIAILMLFAPYHSDSTLGMDWIHDSLVYTIYVLLGLALLFSLPLLRRGELKLDTMLAIVPAIVMFVLNLVSDYDAEGSRLGIILWILFCLLPKDIKLWAFRLFRKMWVLICAIGIVCYLNYIWGGFIPYEEVPYYFNGSSLQYISYGISFIYDSGNSLRLCGICNEPGYLGTFCALILCASGMNLRKKGNIVILIAGLLTFSVAFVMIVVIYAVIKLLMRARQEKNVRRKFLRYIGVLSIAIVYFLILPNIETGNQYVDSTLKRLAVTSEGISGDDRTTAEFDDMYDSASFSDLILGKGRGYLSANGVSGNLSYKVFILEYGVVGCLLIWGTLLMAVLYKNTKNKEVILFAVVFFASIYQRPNVITLPYLVLLLGGIEYIKVCANAKKMQCLNNKNGVRYD